MLFRSVIPLSLALLVVLTLGSQPADAAEEGKARPLSRDGNLSAILAGDGSVVLTWTLDSLAGLAGLNIYRATAPDGPWTRVNAEILAPQSPGMYQDCDVVPGTDYWFALWSVFHDSTELPVAGASCTINTPVSRITWGRIKAIFCLGSIERENCCLPN